MDAERYVEPTHGIILRFAVASAALAAGQILIFELYTFALQHGTFSASSITFYDDLYNYVALVYFPLAFFVIFLLVSRVRVVLERDYAAVMSSIFLGALVVWLPYYLYVAFLQGGTIQYLGYLDSATLYVGLALGSSVGCAFVGFAAVLASYLRRL